MGMKATRHNGRTGKFGVYNVKHNDRNFDVSNSEHIDVERAKGNIYWDCYQGYSLPGMEETILQLGNIDATVDAPVFAKVAAEYFAEFQKRYGSHIHILDWALHLDEGTPHIHERHVFDALNRYGEVCPQQEKALEELGFELPDPTY